MTTYTIAISPEDPAATSATVVVEVGTDGLRIRAVTVRPGADGAPLPPEIVGLDLATLSEALTMLSPGRRAAAPDAAPVGVAPTEEPAAQPRASAAQPRPPAGRGPQPPSHVPSDLGTVYWRLGTVSKVAEHYDVPRPVARDWIKTLRKARGMPDPWRRT